MKDYHTSPVRRTDEEWLVIINECRQSGLSDHEWCNANNIPPSSFYNAVKRLRGSVSSTEISPKESETPYVQDVVQIEVENKPASPAAIIDPVRSSPSLSAKPIELCINGVQLGIDNNADPHLLAEILRLIGGSYAG